MVLFLFNFTFHLVALQAGKCRPALLLGVVYTAGCAVSAFLLHATPGRSVRPVSVLARLMSPWPRSHTVLHWVCITEVNFVVSLLWLWAKHTYACKAAISFKSTHTPSLWVCERVKARKGRVKTGSSLWLGTMNCLRKHFNLSRIFGLTSPLQWITWVLHIRWMDIPFKMLSAWTLCLTSVQLIVAIHADLYITSYNNKLHAQNPKLLPVY